jgi:hypothetical protein
MIVVECYADELLIIKMGFAKKKIHHAGGKGKVLNKVRKLPNAIGIVDEDPNSEQPGELNKYEVIQKKKTITFLKNKNTQGKFLIQISPDLEDWMLKRAKANKINPVDFSLPEKARELHRLTDIKKNKKYTDFIDKIIASDDEIKVMKEWINNAFE